MVFVDKRLQQLAGIIAISEIPAEPTEVDAQYPTLEE